VPLGSRLVQARARQNRETRAGRSWMKKSSVPRSCGNHCTDKSNFYCVMVGYASTTKSLINSANVEVLVLKIFSAVFSFTRNLYDVSTQWGFALTAPAGGFEVTTICARTKSRSKH
ncbi:unnamed protein product, partial [Ectocarpus sp. 4 AP-2014]